MKRVASIALIMMMSLQCFYKLGVVTYFQVNKEFIAAVLCINKNEPVNLCHGQCFLKQKLNLGADSQSKDGNLPPLQRGDLPVFLISENCYAFGSSILSYPHNSRYIEGASTEHHPATFHPPALRS